MESIKIMMPDNTGFVELLESFGTDSTVVDAARVSRLNIGDPLQNEKLISYLAKHNHISPFFHPQIRLRLKMPIFVAREYFRHSVGLARNEISRRYVNFEPECWIPNNNDIREKNLDIKQGSKENQIENACEARDLIISHTETTIQLYNKLLQMNVAPEIARIILPQSMYTLFIETGSLAAYARICKLRLDLSAQKEIRNYAEAIYNIMHKLFPISWKSLMQ